MSKIKLIATDIDGTILKYNFEFNPEVKSCITKLSDDGVKVVLVTGRMHSATAHIASELGLNTPVVSYQGGLVKDGDNILYEKNLNTQYAKEIISWARDNNVHMNLYMNDKLYVEEDSEIIRRYTDERHADFCVTSFDNIELDRINKILLIDFENAQRVTCWRDTLIAKYNDLHIVKSTPYFCEICNEEAKKSDAVNFLKEYWGLDTSEVLTIGDQDNDVELLKAGGVKVAMGNATDNLKAVADFVTDSVNDNGFVKAVEKFVYNSVEV